MGSTGQSRSKSGGQRSNTTSASGQKKRSPTSKSSTGSRVEPSHTADKIRTVREKKASKASKK